MTVDPLRVIREPISIGEVKEIAQRRFGDMAKACVDINIYPDETDDAWIEFDSMINVRPGQGNRSRGVEDVAVQSEIRRVVDSLIRRE